MKGNLCKILLAVSFLFLMPNLCMSQNLKGIWRLVQNDATSQVTRYKVLDKEGKFYNVDAYVKNAMYLEAGNRGTGSVFCPYKITRSGEYNIIAEGLYCEVLHNEYGRTASALVPISYRIDGKVSADAELLLKSMVLGLTEMSHDEDYAQYIDLTFEEV